MAKSPLERQLEAQMKQEKQLANKQKREGERRAREQRKMEREAMIRERAASIVNGQPLIEGFRIMDKTTEEILRCLLACSAREDSHVIFCDDIFPSYVQMSIGLELEKLTQYGMVGGVFVFGNGGMLDLLPPAFSYFEEKKAALARQEQHEKERQQSIINYGNLVFGNVSGSTFTVDNSIHQIEQAIDEKGGEDKEELHEVLDEVKELIENIQSSRSIPKQKRLFEKITHHMEKHGWFYGAVIQLLGAAALGLLGT